MTEQRCLYCGADENTMMLGMACANRFNVHGCVPWYFEERITLAELRAMFEMLGMFSKEETT